MSLSEVQTSVVIIRVSEEGQIRDGSSDLPFKWTDSIAGQTVLLALSTPLEVNGHPVLGTP